MSKRILILFSLFLLSSCVPHKELVYLQDKGVSKQEVLEAVEYKPYRVQLGDQLRIEIKSDLIELESEKFMNLFKISESSSVTNTQGGGMYFNAYVVDDHGNIRMPLLDKVNVLGYTLDEVRVKIENELKSKHFTENTNLFVDARLAGFRFSVNGEVAKVGTQTLFQDRVTIFEAIASAGDITMVGNRKEVNIIRRYPHGSEIHTLDLTNKNILDSEFYYIQPNDYIYVKPLAQKSWGTGTTGSQTLTTVVSVLSLIMTAIVLKRTL